MGTRRKNASKIIVVLGPTTSGKSELAVSIASDFNGEVVSADSRQVYKGMDIGSGKISKKDMKGIPHYCLDIASPKRKFSVAQYQRKAQEAIRDIIKQGKIPILCGGTAFYIKSIIEGVQFPQAVPNWSLRKKLEKKNTKELYEMLKKIDPERSETIEKDNPRRLIRALEIVLETKKPIPFLKTNPEYQPLIIGIKKTEKELIRKIKKRLDERLKKGMTAEIKKLKSSRISWKRLESFGLEYKWLAKYLQKKITHQEMEDNILRDTRKFSKKQMSWWKNDKRIRWIKNKKEAKALVKRFLE